MLKKLTVVMKCTEVPDTLTCNFLNFVGYIYLSNVIYFRLDFVHNLFYVLRGIHGHWDVWSK